MNKILVVDDAIFTRLMITQILARKRLTNVIEAENGRIAVDLFKSDRPDLTLMDITMPELNGLDALKEIIGIDPFAKVIMCSAAANESVVSEALKLGAIDFITKPFRPEQLLRMVQRYLK